jgi:hypothetical protein
MFTSFISIVNEYPKIIHAKLLIALRSLDFQKYLTDLRSSVCLRNKSFDALADNF